MPRLNFTGGAKSAETYRGSTTYETVLSENTVQLWAWLVCVCDSHNDRTSHAFVIRVCEYGGLECG